MSKNAKTMQQASDDMRREIHGHLINVIRWTHLGLTGRFGRAVGTPRRTGEASSGWDWELNRHPSYQPPAGQAAYPPAPVTNVDATMARYQFGDDIHGGNNVGHVSILAGGRRFSPNANRMLGSVQAPGQPPEDFVTLALLEAKDRSDAVVIR